MLVLHTFLTSPHQCPYLPHETAKIEYSYVIRLEPQEYEDLMNCGYRKFGMACFHPVCEDCRKCRPIRVPVDRFRPDRSQRRAWKGNRQLAVRIGPPAADDQHLALFSRYHQAQAERKQWPADRTDAEEYELTYLCSPLPAVEISIWEGRTLRAVVLTDVTPNVISGVYHYHDPALAHRSLGTFCLLQTIELARRLGKAWVYLGFYVAGSRSMEYKARFRPHEIMDEDGVWREGKG